MPTDNVIAGRVAKSSSTLKDKLKAVKDWNKAAKTAADILAASSLRKEAQKMKLQAEGRRKAAEERKQRAAELSGQAAELSKQAAELSRQAAEVSNEAEDLTAEANALTEEAVTLHEDADAISKEEVEAPIPAGAINIEPGAPDDVQPSGAVPVPEVSQNLPVEEALSVATKSNSKLSRPPPIPRQRQGNDTSGQNAVEKDVTKNIVGTGNQDARRPELNRDQDPFFPLPSIRVTRRNEGTQRYISVLQRVLKLEESWDYWKAPAGLGFLTSLVKDRIVTTDASFLRKIDLIFHGVAAAPYGEGGITDFVRDLLSGKED